MIYEEYFIKPYLHCISKEDILQIIYEENPDDNVPLDIINEDIFLLYNRYIQYVKETYGMSTEDELFNPFDTSDDIINDFQRAIFKCISERIVINERAKELAIGYLIKNNTFSKNNFYTTDDIKYMDIGVESPIAEININGYHGYDEDYDEYSIPTWCFILDNWEEIFEIQLKEKQIQEKIRKRKDTIFQLEKNMKSISGAEIQLLEECSLKCKTDVLKAIYNSNPALVLNIIFGEE